MIWCLDLLIAEDEDVSSESGVGVLLVKKRADKELLFSHPLCFFSSI